MATVKYSYRVYVGGRFRNVSPEKYDDLGDCIGASWGEIIFDSPPDYNKLEELKFKHEYRGRTTNKRNTLGAYVMFFKEVIA